MFILVFLLFFVVVILSFVGNTACRIVFLKVGRVSSKKKKKLDEKIIAMIQTKHKSYKI